MLNRDRPIGQRPVDGHCFGIPDMANSGLKRASARSTINTKRESFGWIDSIGMPHGRTGDKLARRAIRAIVGLRHARGPHAGWHLTTGARKSKPKR